MLGAMDEVDDEALAGRLSTRRSTGATTMTDMTPNTTSTAEGAPMGTKASLWTLLLMLVSNCVRIPTGEEVCLICISSLHHGGLERVDGGQTHHVWSWIANGDNEAFLYPTPATGAPKSMLTSSTTHKLERQNPIRYNAKTILRQVLRNHCYIQKVSRAPLLTIFSRQRHETRRVIG